MDLEMEEVRRRTQSQNARKTAKRGAAKTHPTIQAKHNQMYLITSLQNGNEALINRMLPKELILRVFSFLDMKSLCRCAQVCHLWNILALDGSNWQFVDLFTFQKDVKSAVVENLARRCGGFLKKLSLKGCENIQDSTLRTFTSRCANIEHLSLNKCKRVTDSTCENLGYYCHKLMYLNLENCTSITDRALKHIARGCTNLQYLNINWCDNVHDIGIHATLRSCPRLNTLFLKGCEGLTDQMFNVEVEHMQSLVKLNLYSCFVTDETVKQISLGCANLEYLCLSNCSQITDRALHSLASGCKKLIDLELSGCSLLTDGGFIHLSRSCKRLSRLDLEDCSLITDSSIYALATSCPLAQLSLSHCELISDESIQHLCNNNRETIQVLELDNCPLITDVIFTHLRHARQLKRIDLYDCQHISKDAIHRFKQQRPTVEVHAYFAPATPPTQTVPRAGRCCAIL